MSNVIIIDDDKDHLDIADNFCLGEDFRLFLCDSYGEAICALALNDIDLVVLDYEMPVFSGEDILKELSEAYPKMKFGVLSSHNRAYLERTMTGVDFIASKDDYKDFIRKVNQCLKT